MLKRSGIIAAVLFSAVLFSVWLGASRAQAAREYLVTRHLDFGNFSVARNGAQLRIVVAPDGSTAYDPGIYPDTEARPAEYQLTGLPPNMKITLGVTMANPPTDGGLEIDDSTGLANGASPLFTVGDFTSNNPTTDGAGNATLLIGATLTTTGLGGYYHSGAYSGMIDLTFYLD